MADKTPETNPINELGMELRKMFEELFGECLDNDGVYRARVDNLGVVAADAVVEVMLEEGLRDDAPYGVLHFATTLAENIPEESLADLLISLNSLNHVISAGFFPSFGTFCYYGPLNQVYLSYRLPVNLLQIDAEYDNIRYYLGCLYEQLDMFIDFIMFSIHAPGGMTINDYMDYLDQVSDLDDLAERVGSFKEAFDEMMREAGIDPDEIEDIDLEKTDIDELDLSGEEG